MLNASIVKMDANDRVYSRQRVRIPNEDLRGIGMRADLYDTRSVKESFRD